LLRLNLGFFEACFEISIFVSDSLCYHTFVILPSGFGLDFVLALDGLCTFGLCLDNGVGIVGGSGRGETGWLI